VLSKAKGASCCYTSCRRLGVCSADGAEASCGWATCHDDALFVAELLETLKAALPVDPARISITGASNGGMLSYALAGDPRLARAFESIVPVYGGVLRGHLASLGANWTRARVLTIHGRIDSEIPVAGGEARDGWVYEPEAAVLSKWAADHGCPPAAPGRAAPGRLFPTPFDGHLSANLTCHRLDTCSTTPTVVQCLYDGGHGGWPGGSSSAGWAANALVTWWATGQVATLPG
jgi:poly(3-hydroxybutyrate) depolymerase